MSQFGYIELEAMNPQTRATVERLLEDLPFDCDALECKDALCSSKGDYDGARRYLKWAYGHRQKIFKGPW